MPGSKVSIQNRSRRKKTIGKHEREQRTKKIRRKQKRSKRRKQTRRKNNPSISKRHLRRRAKYDQGSGTHSKKGGMRRGPAEPPKGASPTAAAPSRSLQSQSEVASTKGQVRSAGQEAAAAALVAATTTLGGVPAVLAALGVAGVLTKKWWVNKQRAQMDKRILKLQISNLFDGVEEREERVCNGCRKAKERCRWGDDPNTCLRCARLGQPCIWPWLEAFPVKPDLRELPGWLDTALGFGVKPDGSSPATSLDGLTQQDVDDMRNSYQTAVESLYLGAKSLAREGKGKDHWMDIAKKISDKEAGKISEALRKALLEAIPMERVKKDIEDLKQNDQRHGPWILNNKQNIEQIEKNMEAAGQLLDAVMESLTEIRDDMEARRRAAPASPVFTELSEQERADEAQRQREEEQAAERTVRVGG